MRNIRWPSTKKEYWQAIKDFIFWHPINKIKIFYLSRFNKEYMAMDKERRSWIISGDAAFNKKVDRKLSKIIEELK